MLGTWRKILVLALLVAAVAEFTARGPVRLAAATGWNDFLSPFIQANAWVHGQDPYDPRTFVSFWPSDNPRPDWVDDDAAHGLLEKKRGMPSPYPVSTLVVIAPFTLLSWNMALRLWTVISISAVVATPLLLLSICKSAISQLRSQLFLASVFALAPLHTGIATGNPAMVSLSLMTFAFWLCRTGRKKTAAVALALAICLKPTIAGGLLVYYLLRRRWSLVAITCSVAIAIELLGILRLALSGVSWLSSYLLNSQRMFGHGALDDFARADTIRFNMINAQVFFFSLLKSTVTANLITWLIAITMFGCWLWICYRKAGDEVLELSAILILSLVAVYHRFYDAVLLMWPLAWAFLRAAHRSAATLVVLLVAPFFVPGPSLLTNLAESGRIPAGIVHQWWWKAMILPHEAWDLILLAGVLLYLMDKTAGESVLEESPSAPALRERSAALHL